MAETPRTRADALPWWIATAAAALVGLSLGVLTPLQQTMVVLVGIALAGLAVDVISHRLRPYVSAFGLVLAWVGAATLSIPVAGPLPAAACLIFLTVVIGWRSFGYRWRWVAEHEQKVEHRRAIRLIRDHWTKIAHSAGLPPESKIIDDPEPTATGIDFKVSVPGDAQALSSREGTLASTLGTGKTKVTIKADPQNASIAHISVRTHDPLAEPPKPWPYPDVDYRIAAGLSVGILETSRPIVLHFIAEHWLVGGMTRSGKTHVLHMACAAAAAALDAELWIIDTAKRGADFARWEPAAVRYATTAPEAEAMIETLYATMEARYHGRKGAHRTGQWRPSPPGSARGEGPQIILVIDEAANAVRTEKIKARLQHLAAEAAGAGITLVVGTQSPQHAIFDVNTRRNLGTKIALATDSDQASDLILGQGMAGKGYDCSHLPKGGHCFVRRAGDKVPVRARAWWVDDLDFDRFALSLPEVQHFSPHPLYVDRSDAIDTTATEAAPIALPAPTAPGRGLDEGPGPGGGEGPGPDVRAPLHGGVIGGDGRAEAPRGLDLSPDISAALAGTGLTYAEAIYRALLDEPLSQTAVARKVGTSDRTARNTLNRLADVGLAKTSGGLWGARRSLSPSREDVTA
jgi:hypothetical protein